MSELKIYQTSNPQQCINAFVEGQHIAQELEKIGVFFEQWAIDASLSTSSNHEDILATYQSSVDALTKRFDFQSVDVVNIQPNIPNKEAIRKKFLQEHTHTEFEIRFFVDGKGLFCLRADDLIYAVVCEKGDLISVPANTKHWFDMGEHPQLTAIRFFTDTEGWVANYTGDPIADRFPTL